MKRILVVDDSIANLKFVESILKDRYKLVMVKSGEKALAYLEKNMVDLILLDIMMPEMDGFEVYERIKKLDTNKNVSVVFLTADVDVDNEIRGLKMGAVDFIRKPFVPDVMLNRINRIIEHDELNKMLEEKIKEKTSQVEQLSFETIATIASMIEAKDSYTKGHSVRVAHYAAMIAKELGWSDEDIQNLKYIALLHDIGKVGIPDNVLNKPGRLTESEFDIIKSHTTIGGDILKDIETISNVDAGSKFHHERYDGTGYPSGLSGNHIPVVARIICIADTYDAMKSKRVYRDSLKPEEIRKELVGGRGTQFDPEMLDVFLKLFDEGKLEVTIEETSKNKTLSGESSVLINQIMKSIEDEVKKSETLDFLTGLLCRKEGENRIIKAMSEHDGCLAFIDLDNLKTTNDTMGHLAGDYALKTVGEVLSMYSEDAIVARLGGDEFLYYIKNADSKEKAVERIEKVLALFSEKKENNIYLSVSSLSIGMCMTKTDDSYGEVLKKADRALYHVKQSGKCGYYFYDKGESEKVLNNSIDLTRLVANMKEQGSYKGSLQLEYREFAKIYDYIQNLSNRYECDIQLLMITLDFVNQEKVYIEEKEKAMGCMEKAIRTSLRNVDICSRFSGEQFVVILMNAAEEYIEMITKRVEEKFHMIYNKKFIEVQFDVADLSCIE